MADQIERPCWCGADQFVDFSEDYRRCSNCETLVSLAGLRAEELVVHDDEHDFYGREYWLSHQRDALAIPDIFQRIRADLPERDLFWLRTLLAHKLPPARVLELGSAHGGFVALARWAGFDAVGQEMSPWVVDFAHRTFDIPMLLGPLEEQVLQEASFDGVALYDVLEHLDSPLVTILRCVELLKQDGLIIIQTPCYPEGVAYAELVERDDPFLAHIGKKNVRQHLYLFSRRGAQMLMERVGLATVRFEPALFSYDMYFVASRSVLMLTDVAQRSEALTRSAPARLVQALLDVGDREAELRQENMLIERDRLDRIENIVKLNQHIEQISRDYEMRLKVILEQQSQIAELSQQIQHIGAQSEKHLQIIEDQQAVIDRQRASLAKVNRNMIVRALRALRLLEDVS